MLQIIVAYNSTTNLISLTSSSTIAGTVADVGNAQIQVTGLPSGYLAQIDYGVKVFNNDGIPINPSDSLIITDTTGVTMISGGVLGATREDGKLPIQLVLSDTSNEVIIASYNQIVLDVKKAIDAIGKVLTAYRSKIQTAFVGATIAGTVITFEAMDGQHDVELEVGDDLQKTIIAGSYMEIIPGVDSDTINIKQSVLDGKVNVDPGKGLSANDYDDLAKDKVDHLGTIYTKNVGTSPGQIPVLNAAGHFPDSTMPPIAIGEDMGDVDTHDQLVTLSLAQKNDYAFVIADVLPNNGMWLLSGDDYGILSNWRQVIAPGTVLSVNGHTGIVVMPLPDWNAGSTEESYIENKPYIITRNDGIVSWDATISYNSGAICRVGGILYTSSINANLNHDPTAGTTYWTPYSPNSSESTPQDTFFAIIGDGTSTDITVSHNLNSLDVVGTVYSQFGDLPTMMPPMERLNVNQVRFRFVDAPSFASLRVIIERPGTSVSSVTVGSSSIQYGAVVVTKALLAIENVDNTSDANKPVSTAQAAALLLKADASALTAHTGNTSNPHSVTKAQVGLENCDNTSDVNKPVSTAQSIALGFKADTTAVNAALALKLSIAQGVENAGKDIVVNESGNAIATTKRYLGTITGDGSTTDFTLDTGITNPMRPNLTDQNGFEYITECVRVSTTSWKVVFDTAPFGGQIYTVRVTG